LQPLDTRRPPPNAAHTRLARERAAQAFDTCRMVR
jgi:hypothetical protein